MQRVDYERFVALWLQRRRARVKQGEAIRDGAKAVIAPMFGSKMPDWWYEGMADTEDLAQLYHDLDS
ncbi:MAG: hypothetical protein ACTHOU_18765 [Aureliella sp.]